MDLDVWTYNGVDMGAEVLEQSGDESEWGGIGWLVQGVGKEEVRSVRSVCAK